MEYEKKDADVESKIVSEQPSDSKPESLRDVEYQSERAIGTTVQLKRRLQSRHLQMIAIGRATRTGQANDSSDGMQVER